MPDLTRAQKLRRDTSIWQSRSSGVNELERKAAEMIASDHNRGAKNVIAMWKLLEQIRYDNLVAIEGDTSHTVLVDTLPCAIRRQSWVYAISTVSNHSCLLEVSADIDRSRLFSEIERKDRIWIARCPMKHLSPRLINLAGVEIDTSKWRV